MMTIVDINRGLFCGMSFFVVSVGQLDRDLCGAPCGFIFGRDLPNPLNMVLVRLSPVRCIFFLVDALIAL